MALARPECLYCGAPLEAAVVAAAAAAAQALASPAPPVPRVLVLLDLAGVQAPHLAGLLGLSLYEARQRLLRGGVQLHRVLLPEEAQAERQRLRGLSVILVLEEETRSASDPVRVRGGHCDNGRLDLRTSAGVIGLGRDGVIGLVRGPIVREYAIRDPVRSKSLAMATLEPGYRFHLHRQAGPPLELDPWAFEFRERDMGRSSLLTLTDWVNVVVGERFRDDGFRLEPPALSPTEELPAAGQQALGHAETGRDSPRILDNLRQFRFYSGWRAALRRGR